MKEALYYEGLEQNRVKCLLCPQGCVIDDGKRGFCGVRENTEGKLYTLNYERATSVALDPTEKKPLYHFHPGEYILSLGTSGCNMACLHCQNYAISQNPDAPSDKITAHDAVEKAKQINSFGIAYTYNEPFIWYEFVLETSRLAKENGICNVLVTNGFINKDPLLELLPFIDAMNIDFKSIRDEHYRKVCKGRLAPVLETIKVAHASCHIELTNLVIPTLNDSDEDLQDLVNWVYENLGKDVPLHFSRYFPCYKMDSPPTPVETLKKAHRIAKKKLDFVYLGNV